MSSGLSSQQRHEHKLASRETATHTQHTCNQTLSLSLQSRIPLTHPHTRTPLWCQCPHWSRCLDDIVKQLHGLHDVLILQRGKRCARVYVQFVALWRVMCIKLFLVRCSDFLERARLGVSPDFLYATISSLSSCSYMISVVGF